jgi:DNA-binding transcriptional LysR family regulator
VFRDSFFIGERINLCSLEKKLQFDLMDLRLLAATADTGSLSKAASTFPIALSAASNRLKKFEERSQVDVFVRTHAGMTLTPAGRVILDQVRKILLGTVELEQAFNNLCNPQHVSLRIAGTAVTNCTDLLTEVCLFSAEFPKVEVQMSELDNVGVLRALQSDDIEIGIIDGNNMEADLIYLPFKQDNLVLIVASGHSLSTKSYATFNDVLGHQLVCLSPENCLQAYLEDMVAQYKNMLKVRVRAPTFSAISQLVSQNVGIAIMPESAARSELSTSSIQVISLREPWAIWNSWLCVHSWEKLSAHGRQFLSRLVTRSTN